MKQADFSSMPPQLKEAFLLVNPDVQQLKTMHDKDVARMQSFKDVPDDYLGEAVMTQKQTRYPELTAQLIEEFLDAAFRALPSDPARPRGGPMHDVQHISAYIARPPVEVYEFASDPRNLPRWAVGLARSEVRRDGDDWIADAPFGMVRVRFVQRNSFGVMDHDVTLESGVTVHNPMRVVPNGDGSELVSTLFRRPGMSDGQFDKDKAAVENDLEALKDLLERKSRSQPMASTTHQEEK